MGKSEVVYLTQIKKKDALHTYTFWNVFQTMTRVKTSGRYTCDISS